ncbi:F-box-like domain-containing protein [Legionella dresdenensis]|uniref:F-box-like domain-containing protein n=1 Tax=Legionella dresdenensis TaxID=450200 RepID=A0ABV8CGK0_9GAMM
MPHDLLNEISANEIFSDEIFLQVFASLNPKQLVKAAEVCLHWQRLTADDNVASD